MKCNLTAWDFAKIKLPFYFYYLNWKKNYGNKMLQNGVLNSVCKNEKLLEYKIEYKKWDKGFTLCKKETF